MSIHIIIDGYNLIRQSQTFSVLDRQDIQHGREALIDALAEYKKIKRHKITVVFDGTNAPFFSTSSDRIKGIRVKFSRNKESADTVIKRIAASEKERALIVSSDHDIVNFALSKGCATINSAGFEQKIALAVPMETFISDDDSDVWIPTTKKKGPRKRLPKKKRQSRIKIQKL